MSLTTHSPQESPCSACYAPADWNEIITRLLDSLTHIRNQIHKHRTGGPETVSDSPVDILRDYQDLTRHLGNDAQAALDKVRSLLSEERREK